VAAEELRVVLLDVRRVGEHDGGQIARGRRTPDSLVVAFAREQRQPARVIHVGVTQDDGADLVHRQRESQVLGLRLPAPPLEETTVEEDGLAVGSDDVAGPGDLAGGAGEFYFHAIGV
jgi:hypothetical protein